MNMQRQSVGLVILTAFALCARGEEPGSSAGATLFSGVEVSNQDSRRWDLGVSLASSGGTTFELAGSRTRTDAETIDLESTHAYGQVSRDFGRVGFGVGARHVRDEGVSKTLGWMGSAHYNLGGMRLSGNLERRGMDFADTPFTATGEELGMADVEEASGVASCSVDSLGYGLGFRATRSKWTFFMSGTLFDYSSFECATTVTSTTVAGGGSGSVPGRGGVTAPGVARDLAGPAINRYDGYSSSRAPQEAAILKSSVTAGTSVALGSRSVVGFQLFRDQEQFAEGVTHTALAFVSVSVNRVFGFEFTTGMTRTNQLDDSLFAGVTLFAHLGR